MESATGRIAEFALRTEFDEIPPESTDRIKQVLLDSIGCALAGQLVDRGRLAIEFAQESGGKAEASIIGGLRSTCDLASFVNGELISALDADSTGPLTAHVCPYVLPSTLALAERVRASGKEVVTALAIAHEIGARVASSLAQGRIPKDEPPYFEEAPRFTWAWTLFGGVAGGGRLLGLDVEQLCSAFGIAGASCPVAGTLSYQHEHRPLHMVKFNTWSGWVSRLATVAPVMAKKGLTGDTAILDDREWGFWKMAGSPFYKVDRLLAGLGESWSVDQMEFKQFPACGLNQTGADAIISIMRQHGIKPQDIQEIVVRGEPALHMPFRSHPAVETFTDAQFTNTYVYAAAAFHGDAAGPVWQLPDSINHPDITALMQRIKVEPHPRSLEFLAERARAGLPPGFRGSQVEITANGRKHSQEILVQRGTSANPMTQDEIRDKFRAYASYSPIARDNSEEIIDIVENLETLGDITELTRLWTAR